MRTIKAANVNHAYNAALWLIKVAGYKETSRNGEVTTVDGPVITMYERPWQRMLFDTARDANPFFHVMEAMWMLAGRNDVAAVSKYVSNMTTFSDDGKTLNGAYGHRWREQFDTDQIDWVIDHLKSDNGSRRAVIAMWDPANDPWAVTDGSKDVPCNTTIYFRVTDGKLTMTVSCRSNDIVWGCYGANAVHMSYLHELVALGVGIPMGPYYQISNNWHIYPRHYPLMESVSSEFSDPYAWGIEHSPLIHTAGEPPILFADSLNSLFDGGDDYKAYTYGRDVLQYVKNAWEAYKVGATDTAQYEAPRIEDPAIRQAGVLRPQRRVK